MVGCGKLAVCLNKPLLLEAQVEPRRRATWKGKLRLGHSLCFMSFRSIQAISSLHSKSINVQYNTLPFSLQESSDIQSI